MKAFKKLTAIVAGILALLILTANLAFLRLTDDPDRAYRVEISRAAAEIQEKGLENLDFSQYPSLTGIAEGEGPEFFAVGNEYAIREIDGRLYRFEYEREDNTGRKLLVLLNFFLGTGAVLILLILFFLQKEVLKPFEILKSLPEELAKGNLTIPLQQQKSRYFGKFLWGMDLLREKLESQKAEELKLQKEKKSLILSLAHDIKTPLSAMKLYSQALGKNLYEDPEKQREIAGKIGEKVDEIEDYMGKIVKASQEDFLHLEVQIGEFYLADVAEKIRSYYKEKLDLLKIPCTMDFGENCMLKGDRDRVVEILQNLIENAIKYGGGGKITVFSWEEDGCRILTVRNENCSLNPSELNHIFDSFFRGSNSEKIQGSGLGLYICLQLSRAMGGDVFAEIKEKNMEVSVVLPKA